MLKRLSQQFHTITVPDLAAPNLNKICIFYFYKLERVPEAESGKLPFRLTSSTLSEELHLLRPLLDITSGAATLAGVQLCDSDTFSNLWSALRLCHRVKKLFLVRISLLTLQTATGILPFPCEVNLFRQIRRKHTSVMSVGPETSWGEAWDRVGKFHAFLAKLFQLVPCMTSLRMQLKIE